MEHTKHLKVLLSKVEGEIAKTMTELGLKEKLNLEECQKFMNRAAQLKYEIQALDKAVHQRKIDINFDKAAIKDAVQSALLVITGEEVVDVKQEEEKQEQCLIQPVQNSSQLLLFNLEEKAQKIVLATPFTFPKHFAVEQLGWKVYVAGGRSKGYAIDKFFSVNIKAQFSHYESLNQKRAYSVLRKLKESELLLASGGISLLKVLKSCELFDLERGKWKEFADLKKARCCHSCACVEKQKPYVFAGWVGQSHKIESIEKYIKETASWVELKVETHLGRRDDLFSFSYLNGIYIFGEGKKSLDNFYFSSQTDSLGRGRVKSENEGSSECRTRIVLPKGRAFYVSDDYELYELNLK